MHITPARRWAVYISEEIYAFRGFGNPLIVATQREMHYAAWSLL